MSGWVGVVCVGGEAVGKRKENQHFTRGREDLGLVCTLSTHTYTHTHTRRRSRGFTSHHSTLPGNGPRPTFSWARACPALHMRPPHTHLPPDPRQIHTQTTHNKTSNATLRS